MATHPPPKHEPPKHEPPKHEPPKHNDKHDSPSKRDHDEQPPVTRAPNAPAQPSGEHRDPQEMKLEPRRARSAARDKAAGIRAGPALRSQHSLCDDR